MYKRKIEDLHEETLQIEVLQQHIETAKLESIILWAKETVYYILDLE